MVNDALSMDRFLGFGLVSIRSKLYVATEKGRKIPLPAPSVHDPGPVSRAVLPAHQDLDNSKIVYGYEYQKAALWC